MMNKIDLDDLNRMKKVPMSDPKTGGKARRSRKDRIAQAMANYAAAPEGLRTSDQVRDVMHKRGLYAKKARPGTALLLGKAAAPKPSGRINIAASLGRQTSPSRTGRGPGGAAKFIRATSNETPRVDRGSRPTDPLALRDGAGAQERGRVVSVVPDLDNSPRTPAELKAAGKRINEMKAGGYVEPPAYDPKPGEGGEVAYQNLMRSLGYLNTQDYSGGQQSYQNEASKDALRDFAKTVGWATSIALMAGEPGVAARVLGILLYEAKNRI